MIVKSRTTIVSACLLVALFAGAAISVAETKQRGSDTTTCCSQSTYADLPIIHFESDSAELDASGTEKLQRLASMLSSDTQMKLLVLGHTDNQGSEHYNKALSSRRTSVVINYLTDLGIDSERLNSVAHSELRPMSSNTSAEGRAKNRRVVFVQK